MESSGAFESFLPTQGLLAIFVIMLLKQIGLPIPIPSDIITITAGVQAATGSFTFLEVMVAIEVAVIIGSTAQFFIVRSAGRRLLYRGGRLIGLTPERLDKASAALKRRGALAVFLGLNIPGARAGVIPAAALAGLSYLPVAVAMIAGTIIFYGWHVALGYVVGPSATTLLERYDIPIWQAALGLIALGLVGWLLLRRRRKAGAGPENQATDRLRSWTEAACPGCLAATAIERSLEKAPPA